jgi:type IV pilus assembly protein PilE
VGFTLIELMITVAIVAILAAIAYPSYQNYLKKGRRAAAQGFMMEVANKQQQYLIDSRGYALGSGGITTLGLTPPPETTNFYTWDVCPSNATTPPPSPPCATTATTPPSFTIIATPVSTSAQANDGVLTVNNLGGKTYKGNAGW